MDWTHVQCHPYTCHIQPKFHQAQPISNSLLQMSPSSSGLMSGIPWQITSFTDLQHGRNFTEIVATCKLNFTQGQGSSQIRTYIHIHTQLRVMHSSSTHLVRSYKLIEITSEYLCTACLEAAFTASSSSQTNYCKPPITAWRLCTRFGHGSCTWVRALGANLI